MAALGLLVALLAATAAAVLMNPALAPKYPDENYRSIRAASIALAVFYFGLIGIGLASLDWDSVWVQVAWGRVLAVVAAVIIFFAAARALVRPSYSYPRTDFIRAETAGVAFICAMALVAWIWLIVDLLRLFWIYL